MEIYRLNEAPENGLYKVVEIDAGRGASEKLSNLGIFPGDIIRRLNKPNGGPVLLAKGEGGGKIAVGKGLAGKIMVAHSG